MQSVIFGFPQKLWKTQSFSSSSKFYLEEYPGLGKNLTHRKGDKMATYKCNVCGMSVNATCGECNAPLENDVLKKDDGTEVQISKCPNGHGKIKSPQCCGQDMACSLG